MVLTAVPVRTLHIINSVNYSCGSAACHVIISDAYQQWHRVLALSVPLTYRIALAYAHTTSRLSPIRQGSLKKPQELYENNPCIVTVHKLFAYVCVCVCGNFIG